MIGGDIHVRKNAWATALQKKDLAGSYSGEGFTSRYDPKLGDPDGPEGLSRGDTERGMTPRDHEQQRGRKPHLFLHA